MPLAVTHVLTAGILVGLYRDFVTKHKRYFTLHTVFIGALFGLMPDIDIPLRMIAKLLGFNVPWLLQHGGITHTPLFALLILIPGLVIWYRGKHRLGVYFFVAAFGIFIHLLLDFLIGGGAAEGIMWFFPISMEGWKIHLIKYFNMQDLPAALDAVLLLGWLWYIEVKHKLSDFI